VAKSKSASGTNKHENAASPSDKLVSQVSRAVKKIETQIVRFHKMPWEEKKKYFDKHGMSSFCTLKTPSGGELLYGAEGDERFNEICHLLVRFAPQIDGKVSYSVIKESVKSGFCDVFVVGGADVGLGSARKMLEHAMNSVVSKFKSFEHHIPCIFFTEDSPDIFYVGPVKFTKMSLFLRMTKDNLKKYSEDKAGLSEVVDSHFERSIAYYEEFPWVASVTIEQCDFATSLENAIFNCNTALNVVRILFGRDRTKWIRLGTSQGEPLKTANMWSVDNDEIQCSISSRIRSPSGPGNWFEYLNNDQGLEIKMFLGHIIEYSRVFKPHSELSSRLLDAINWFGDACLETSPAAAVVKYVTSIERLYFGSQYQGMKSKFSSRVSRILIDFECEGTGTALEAANKIYEVRSTLVHGAVSQRLNDDSWPLYLAEELARNCLFCAEQMYMIIHHGFNPLTTADFESAFVEYEKNGLLWCIEKAKMNEASW
jgi:hypothetical protein